MRDVTPEEMQQAMQKMAGQENAMKYLCLVYLD